MIYIATIISSGIPAIRLNNSFLPRHQQRQVPGASRSYALSTAAGKTQVIYLPEATSPSPPEVRFSLLALSASSPAGFPSRWVGSQAVSIVAVVTGMVMWCASWRSAHPEGQRSTWILRTERELKPFLPRLPANESLFIPRCSREIK